MSTETKRKKKKVARHFLNIYIFFPRIFFVELAVIVSWPQSLVTGFYSASSLMSEDLVLPSLLHLILYDNDLFRLETLMAHESRFHFPRRSFDYCRFFGKSRQSLIIQSVVWRKKMLAWLHNHPLCFQVSVFCHISLACFTFYIFLFTYLVVESSVNIVTA